MELLRKDGWRMFYPQNYNREDRLKIYKSAHHISCMWMSAADLLHDISDYSSKKITILSPYKNISLLNNSSISSASCQVIPCFRFSAGSWKNSLTKLSFRSNFAPEKVASLLLKSCSKRQSPLSSLRNNLHFFLNIFFQFKYKSPGRKKKCWDKIYISRSRLESSKRLTDGEMDLEKLLSQDGWHIFHPQEHDIRTQLEVYSSASYICSTWSSALHLLYGINTDKLRKVVVLSLFSNSDFVRQFSAQCIPFKIIKCLKYSSSCEKIGVNKNLRFKSNFPPSRVLFLINSAINDL
jgi:hypothetical protein